MFGFKTLWKAITSKTAEVYCVTCRKHQQVTVVRYVETAQRKRIQGQCRVCGEGTSTFVAA